MQTLPDNHDINHLRGALRHCKRFGCAVDGGAHTGGWTRLFSQCFEKTYAFEPVRENYDRIPDFSNVKKYNLALSDEKGDFFMSPGPENEGQWHFSDDVKEKMVPAKTARLDDFHIPVDFLKLDVEGYELFALKGALATIKKHKPMILLELNGLSERYGHTDNDVRIFLNDLGYIETGRWNKDILFSL